MKKSDLKAVMATAWAVRKSENVTMSEALRQAWKSFKLKMRMKTEVVKFAFRKVDGTLREAVGTLMDSVVSAYERKTKGERTPNYSLQTYWDMEKQQFRCYKVSGLLYA